MRTLGMPIPWSIIHNIKSETACKSSVEDADIAIVAPAEGSGMNSTGHEGKGTACYLRLGHFLLPLQSRFFLSNSNTSSA